MKARHILCAAAFAAMALALGSCELESSDNGDLDGMWYLASVDTIATSGKKDMTGERLFWSFQHKLLVMKDKTGKASGVLMRFEHKDGKMRLYDPHFDNRSGGDPELDDPVKLQPFGVQMLEETFKVEHLTSRRMVLESGTLRLGFKKI